MTADTPSAHSTIEHPGTIQATRRTFNGFAAPDPGAHDYVFAVGLCFGSDEDLERPVGGWRMEVEHLADELQRECLLQWGKPVFGDFEADGTTPVTTRSITIQAAGVTRRACA